MQKSELPLQITVFGMTAVLVALILVKFYPVHFFKPDRALATNVLVSPVSEPLKPFIEPKAIPPTNISISSISLSLTIGPAVITNNIWTLYDDKVSWLTTSKALGFGNTILYAHNRDHLFGSLKKLNIGDEIKVTAQNKSFVYVVSEKRKILPTDVDAILSDRNQLTLYTCDGAFDQKRLIVIALPKS